VLGGRVIPRRGRLLARRSRSQANESRRRVCPLHPLPTPLLAIHSTCTAPSAPTKTLKASFSEHEHQNRQLAFHATVPPNRGNVYRKLTVICNQSGDALPIPAALGPAQGGY